ncbi:sigma factor-like helix-turn-helix DNA-binding protein [Jatrophihabitans sp.]|uniref:sigma factor-like helix-turn-helix DNA-binding protein n=1 Tax=Jatrophihabitans sp. TaxID=1932789 RepID=UPI0030C6DBF2|nr:hypothetical protein [Jatrophihabitans sp.]
MKSAPEPPAQTRRSAIAARLRRPRHAAGGFSVAETDRRRAWAHEVADCLATLKAEERTYLLFSYVDGLHQNAIAAQVGVSRRAVARTIASGMRGLALALETGAAAPLPLLAPPL